MRTIFAVILCAAALSAADAPRPAQRFLLPDVKGRDHDLYDYKGKVVVLEFMQTACPHCGAFTSVLKQVQQRYRDRVAVMAVVNPPDTPELVSTFMAMHAVSYPILLDAGRVAFAYIRRQTFNIPYVFLIDGNTQVREQWEYSPATLDIFEGNGLFPAIDNLLGASFGSSPAPKK